MAGPDSYDKELQEKGLECNAAHLLSRPFLFEKGARVGSRHTGHICFIGKGCAFGRFTYINGGLVRPNTTIGRYSSIGHGVTLGAPEHRLSRLSTHPVASGRPAAERATGYESGAPPGGRHVGQTLIGSDVWIGDGAVILAGVTVGHGAVIGANAVVTQDVDPYSIVGGVPARLIRHRFNMQTIGVLMRRNWFDLDHNLVLQLPMDDIGACVAFLEKLEDDQFVQQSEYTSV